MLRFFCFALTVSKPNEVVCWRAELVTKTDNTTLLVDLNLSLSSVMSERQAVAVYDYRSAEQFQTSVCPLREPVVLRGCPLGPCTDTWSPAHQ